jgi:ABC-type branched-subunit amino acid transport system substrate-binding protein
MTSSLHRPRAVWLVLLLTVVLVAAGCGTRQPREAGSPATEVTTPAGPNPASDVGVSPTEVTVGLIVSKTSPLGPETFSPPSYGAQAFFTALNQAGGVAGRMVKVVVCDDESSGAGNLRCVRKLIDDDKVFAFAGNSIFDYAGAEAVSQAGVPDVGGQPIGSAYAQYQHLYSIYGTSAPRDGTVGWDGTLYGGTEVQRWFKENLGARTAAVVAYNQADSLRFADLTAKALELEGYSVVREQVDFGVPNMDAAVIDMRSKGVDIVFDAIDSAGNVTLCKSMDANGFQVKAKVTSVQSWNQSVATDYAAAPNCRRSLYATATDLNYADASVDVVSRFRDDMHAAFPERDPLLSMWELEGWASAQWLTDAMESCGAQLTRSCVEAYVERAEPYDGHGLLTPRDFTVSQDPAAPDRNCLSVAQWSDEADGGAGGWESRTPVGSFDCFEVPNVPYKAG